MKKHIIILFLSLYISTCFSQNLVMNPDFEIFFEDSTYLNYGFNHNKYHKKQGYKVDDWRSIYMDFETKVGAIHIKDNEKICKSGTSCVQVCLGCPKEYCRAQSIIQGRLLKKLEKDKRYKIEFYLKKNSNANAMMNRVDVYFGGESFVIDTLKALEPYYTYEGEYLSDSYRWTKIEGIITAKGDERYIYFGAIKNHHESCKVLNTKTYLSKFADYYIDNIQLTVIN